MRKPQTYFLVTLALLGGSLRGNSSNDADLLLEARIRAAFVLNFIQFIDWPESAFSKPDSPIVIGVLDPDPFQGALAAAIEGKTVHDRKLVIRPIAGGPVTGCQVLIVGNANAAKTAELIKALGEAGVLTIGDQENFTEVGGAIRFYVDDRKERFEINLTAAERAHLQISSKLLKLAKVVHH